MAHLFARIELRGSPGENIYQQLHEYMASLNWHRTIDGTTEAGNPTTKDLPHATYQADTVAEDPNLLGVAQTLRSAIESNIWSQAIVLVIRWAGWGQAG